MVPKFYGIYINFIPVVDSHRKADVCYVPPLQQDGQYGALALNGAEVRWSHRRRRGSSVWFRPTPAYHWANATSGRVPSIDGSCLQCRLHMSTKAPMAGLALPVREVTNVTTDALRYLNPWYTIGPKPHQRTAFGE